MSRILTGTLVAGGVLALYAFVKRLHKTQLNLEALPKASLHKVSLQGVTMRLDIVLKNPTKGHFSIKFPFVKLSYQGATVGTSQVLNKDIEIPAYGQAVIEKIMIDIPLVNAFSVTSSVLKAVQNKVPVKMKAEIKTIVSAGMINMPFEKTYDLAITNPKPDGSN